MTPVNKTNDYRLEIKTYKAGEQGPPGVSGFSGKQTNIPVTEEERPTSAAADIFLGKPPKRKPVQEVRDLYARKYFHLRDGITNLLGPLPKGYVAVSIKVEKLAELITAAEKLR